MCDKVGDLTFCVWTGSEAKVVHVVELLCRSVTFCMTHFL